MAPTWTLPPPARVTAQPTAPLQIKLSPSQVSSADAGSTPYIDILIAELNSTIGHSEVSNDDSLDGGSAFGLFMLGGLIGLVTFVIILVAATVIITAIRRRKLHLELQRLRNADERERRTLGQELRALWRGDPSRLNIEEEVDRVQEMNLRERLWMNRWEARRRNGRDRMLGSHWSLDRDRTVTAIGHGGRRPVAGAATRTARRGQGRASREPGVGNRTRVIRQGNGGRSRLHDASTGPTISYEEAFQYRSVQQLEIQRAMTMVT